MPRRDRIAATARQVEALQLRGNGRSYAEIGQALGITKQAAHKLVTRALDATLRETAEQTRLLELDCLDRLTTEAVAVLGRFHYVVQGGEIIKDDDGQPLRDDGPVLAAVGQLVRLGESRRKLLGIDAPAQARVLADVSRAEAWRRSTPEQHDALLAAELAELGQELARRGPPTPPPAETIPPDLPAAAGDVHRLAEAVAAGLAAAGVDLDRVDLDRVADAVEGYLQHRGGRP